MADGLVAEPEAGGEALDVVARLLGSGVEDAVRKDQGCCEVVGDADAGQGVRRGPWREVLGCQPVDFLAVFEQGELCRHAERPLARPEATRQVQGA